jgi:hypothetical protein
MVEIPRHVMPVKTGIQVRFWLKFNTRLDSGVRRKDKKTVDFQSTTPESSACSSGSLSRPYSILHSPSSVLQNPHGP